MPALAALDLAVIVFWLGVLIFCFLALKIAQALLGAAGGAVGWIPLVGGFVKTEIEKVAQKITHVMGGAMGYADQHVAAAIHDTARLVDWVGREIASHANILLMVAQALTGQLPVSYIVGEIHRLTHLGDQGAQALRGIGQDVLPRIKAVERGIGSDVLPHLHVLDREIGRVIAHDVPLLRDQVRGLEDGAINTFRWIRTHPLSAATAAFVAAVAYALARLGGTWIRCKNWNRIGKHVCGLPTNLIEDLLGLSLALLAVVDPVVIAKAAIKTEDTAHGIVTKIADLNPEQG